MHKDVKFYLTTSLQTIQSDVKVHYEAPANRYWFDHTPWYVFLWCFNLQPTTNFVQSVPRPRKRKRKS